MNKFKGSFKNYKSISSNSKEAMLTKLLLKKGVSKIPDNWFGNGDKIPVLNIDEANNCEKENVFSLYIDKKSDLKNIGNFPNLVSLNYYGKSIPKKVFQKAKELRYVELNCENLEEIPSELSTLENLKFLILSGSTILSDISCIKKMNKLAFFSLTDNGEGVKDWAVFKDSKIETLKLNNLDVGLLKNNLKDLQNLKNLTCVLKFQDSIKTVLGINELQTLNIEIRNNFKNPNKIDSVNTILQEQTNLNSLVLEVDEYFSDYSGVQHIKGLKNLYLGIPNYDGEQKCDILDIPEYFENLVELEELHIKTLKSTYENDFTAFTKLKNLKRLYLGNSKMTQLPDAFGKIISLEELWLSHCEKISSLKPLKACKLQVLILEYCGYDNDVLVDDILEIPHLNYIIGKFENRTRGVLSKAFKSAIILSE